MIYDFVQELLMHREDIEVLEPSRCARRWPGLSITLRNSMKRKSQVCSEVEPESFEAD